MDKELLAFVATRVSEEEQAARRASQVWAHGVGNTPQASRSVSIARRGVLEIADDLIGRSDADVAALGKQLLLYIAMMYADHPDYQREWHPKPS